MSKDQSIGVIIFVACVVIALGYVVLLFAPQPLISLTGLALPLETLKFWLVAIPVLVAFIAIMFIGAWIGWTMATTPPPKPIEKLEEETSTSPTEAT